MAKQVVVKPGESLWKIAERELGSGARWEELGTPLGITTEEQARELKPGTVLTIPTTEEKTSIVPTDRHLDEITKLKKQIEETTEQIEEAKGLLEKARAYPYLEETEEIPEWIIEAESPEEVAKLAKPKRIEELEKSAFAPAPKSYEEVFTEAYETAGLEDVKKKIEDLDKRILDTKQKLYSEEAEINENPWLSEASRVGRIKRLYQLAQQDIDLLVEQRKSLAEQYKAGIGAAEKVAERTLKGWEREQKVKQVELNYLTKSGKGDEHLSVSEAKTLGVPYGTTKEAARGMGITPEGVSAGGPEGVAVFEDTNTGKTYDIGTVRGLKDFKTDHPEYTYEDMDAWMDANVKGLDATTRRNLLDGAGFEKAGAGKPGMSFDEMAKSRARTIEEAKNRGIGREVSKTQLISQFKKDLGLGKSDDLPDQYSKLVEDIIFAVYGGTFWQKLLLFGRAGILGTTQEEIRNNLGL